MLDRIRAAVPALPPAERRVARLLLDDPRAFASLPVGTLAARAGVSKPTVVRFCRSVGYGGLADFKLKLAGSVSEGVPFVHRAVSEDDSAAELLVKVVDNALSALVGLRNAAFAPAYGQAVDALAEAGSRGRRIEFYGVGNSGIVAHDAQHKFFRLGVRAVASSDSHVQVMSATLLDAGDCAVLISNSGRSRDLLDVAAIAREQGATTIALTVTGSPLARATEAAGHVFIAVDHRESPDRYSPMVSRLLHLTAVDVLATGVALRLGAAVRPRLQAMKHHLAARRQVAIETESATGTPGRGR